MRFKRHEIDTKWKKLPEGILQCFKSRDRVNGGGVCVEFPVSKLRISERNVCIPLNYYSKSNLGIWRFQGWNPTIHTTVSVGIASKSDLHLISEPLSCIINGTEHSYFDVTILLSVSSIQTFTMNQSTSHLLPLPLSKLLILPVELKRSGYKLPSCAVRLILSNL